MRVKDVAARLDLSATTVYALIESGKIKHYRIGNGRGVVRIAEQHLADYLKSVESKPPGSSPPLVFPARPRRLKHLRAS
jgi:excisionase family DNA binding protein